MVVQARMGSSLESIDPPCFKLEDLVIPVKPPPPPESVWTLSSTIHFTISGSYQCLMRYIWSLIRTRSSLLVILT